MHGGIAAYAEAIFFHLWKLPALQVPCCCRALHQSLQKPFLFLIYGNGEKGD